jgi:uncharacterized protein YyaL (SSP411 family)
MNRLSQEKSPYLQHAAHQKIDWYPWSDEAFETAERENKPVFLSSGAVWCHWCHVMARECFANAEIVKLLNESFISIKLDRDERPDIDRRYQQALHAMGSGGGWPLSVFLAPDKKPFFGGTYFPPEDNFGRPGFKKVLKAIIDLYHSKRGEMSEYGNRIIDSLKQKSASGSEITKHEIDRAVTAVLSQFDPQHGGFGSSPKFPVPGAIEFLINRYFFTKKESVAFAVKTTLESMAKGGFCDQIGGGFHRYSVDEAWIIPHFEKMAEDNAWHLRNYLDAYAASGNKYFKEIAGGIIHFVGAVLSDAEGGFFASQDADVTPEDEGGYFTWTEREFRESLDDEEYKILSLHLLDDRGSMHHDKSKKVLFVAMEASEIAGRIGLDIAKVVEIIETGKRKLLDGRIRRETPFVDKTLYASTNGLMISSYIKAFRVLGEKSLKDFALKSLERIMKSCLVNDKLFHREGVDALLDDYINLIDALIAAYEITGDPSCLRQADNLIGVCIDKFWDEEEGGFFDTDREVIELRLKHIEDLPHPSANSLGIILLLKLYLMTGEKAYHHYAESSLKAFSLQTKDLDIHAGYYFCALDAYFNMIKLTMETSPSSGLSKAAFSSFRPYASLVYGEDKGRVIPCVKDVCYEPVGDAERLRDFLRKKHFS